jgi:hypothetical protein
MSKISTYSLADSPLQLSDRLIGTEAPRPIPSSTPLATKNFSLGELLQLFSSEFPAATLQAVLNAGNIATQDIDLTGTIFVDLIKPTNIEDMLGSQGTPFQILSKAIGGFNWIDLPTSITLTTNGSSGASTLIGGVLNIPIYSGGGGTTPNLQQVTTAGAFTTDAIQVGGITAGNFVADGFTVTVSDNFDGNYNFFYFPYVGLNIGNGIGLSIDIYQDASIGFTNTSGGIGNLRSDLLTAGRTWQLPDADGTLALTIDIPTATSQLTNDGADGVNPFITLADIPTGGGTVTSVDLSMPSAFTVTNNPITTSGTLTVTLTGTVSEYIRGDGSLANFPDIDIPTLQEVVTAGPTITTSFTHVSASYENTFNAAGITIIDKSIPGLSNNVSYQANGIFRVYAGLTQAFVFGEFEGTGPTFRTITIPNKTGTMATLDDIPTLVAGTNITIDDTDPLNPIISSTGSGGGGTVTSVAALTLGDTGTDLTSTVADGTTTPVITLNVPTASAANRGALSSADWTTFNNKQVDLWTFQRTQGVYFFEDFLGQNDNSSIGNSTGVTMSSSGVGAANRITGVFPNRTNQQGAAQLTTGTTALGAGSIRFGSNNTPNIYLGIGTLTYETYINIETLSTGTERYIWGDGLISSANYIAAVQGAYFIYDEGGAYNGNVFGASPNFRAVTVSSSVIRTVTNTNIAVTAGIWVKLRIEVNSTASQILFYIDDALVATHTNNLPAATTPLFISNWFTKTIGITSRSIFKDYLAFRYIFTNPR